MDRSVHIVVSTFVSIGLASSLVWSAELTFIEAHFDNSAGVDGIDGANSVDGSGDGKFLYVGGSSDSAIALFNRDRTTGTLSFVSAVQNGVDVDFGLSNVLDLVISPDDLHLYAAGSLANSVVVFERSSTTGALTFIEKQKDGEAGVDGLAFVNSLAVSHDGKNLYASAVIDDAVAVFNRDPTTGALTWVQALKDGIGGVEGLDGSWWVAVSPDDKSVYVAARYSNSVAVFVRDVSSGELTFVEAHYDGAAGVVGLDQAEYISVSPDGLDVYVAGENSLVQFRREPTTSELTYVRTNTDSVLNACRSVEITPGGHWAFATGEGFNDRISLFSRNTVTGELSFVEVHHDGSAGVQGLDGVNETFLSPDRRFVYASASLGDAVSVFSFLKPIFSDGFESGETTLWSASVP